MRRIRILLLVLLTLFLPAACGDLDPVPRAGPLTPDLYVIAEDDRPEPGQFLRYATPGPRGGGLDIAIADYAHPDGGAMVSLVGVVHIADPPYFERIQQVLDSCDTVLYEAVMPEGQDVIVWQKDAAEELRALGGFQQELASWFGFVFQLDALDYDRPHFVHADMTLEAFREAGGDVLFPEDGDDPGALLEGMPEAVRDTFGAVRAFGRAMMGKPNPFRSLARKMFAETMGTVDIGTALDMFPGLSDLVLTKRNDVVMTKLEEILADAEGRVTVFYGAAHMPDLEQELLEMGYERTDGRWLRAWALRAPLPR